MQLESIDSSPKQPLVAGSEPCPPGRTRSLIVHLAQAAAAHIDADALLIRITDSMNRCSAIRTVAAAADREVAGELEAQLLQWTEEAAAGQAQSPARAPARGHAIHVNPLNRRWRPLRAVAEQERFDRVTRLQIRLDFALSKVAAITAAQQELMDRLCLAIQDALRIRQEHLDDAARLAALYVASPALLLMLDGNANVLATNALCGEHFKWVRERIVGQPLQQLVSEACRAGFESQRAHWWRQGGCRDWPCDVVTGDGQVRPVLLSMSIEYGPTGEAISVKCALVDLTGVRGEPIASPAKPTNG